MPSIPAEQSFTNTLEKLELLAKIQERLPDDDCTRHEDLINKEIGTLLEVSKDDWTTKNRLELHHRLITVREGLNEARTEFNYEELDLIITNVVSGEAPLRQLLDEELTRPPSSLKSWSVPIVSCISKPDHWHQKDHGSLAFGFNIHEETFVVTNDRGELYSQGGSDVRFIAIAVVGQYNHIRVIPVHGNPARPGYVCEIKLQKVEHAQTMINKLLEIGCTVVSRPDNDSALEVDLKSHLSDMAARLPGPK